MRYLLDSNTCIRYLNKRSQNVIDKLNTLSPDDVLVCSITKAELFYGAMRSHNPQKTLATQQEFLNQFESLPFNDSAAEIYSRIRSKLAALGTPIGPNDLLIASIALANNLVLVTHNINEFSRVDGLQLEDWE